MAETGSIFEQFDLSAVFLLSLTLAVFLIPIFILFPPIPVERSDSLSQTHSKLGLTHSQSKLRNQYSQEHKPQPGRPTTVQSLHIYPIKSCRGIELTHSKVLPTGLEYDRLYTFAQLKDQLEATTTEPAKPLWEFVTQRQLPLLANVKVDLWLPDAQKTSRQLGNLDEGFLVLRFPWADSGLRGWVQRVAAKLSRSVKGVPEKEVMLPINFPSKEEILKRNYEFADVKIWKEVTFALNMQSELPPELKLYLGAKHKLGLFRMDPGKQREVFRCAPRKEDVGFQPIIDFQDAYPLHMLSLSSLQAFDSIIQKDENILNLDARRFRSNIIITGSEEYDEETWKSIRCRDVPGTEGIIFDVSCRTVRCKMPNVDPATGIRHKLEPDHSLRKHRDVDEGAPKNGCLGMQLCPLFRDADKSDCLEAYVKVGMEVQVLKRGTHVYVKQ